MMPGMGGMDPRQMAMMMRKMGIQVQDIPDVEEVIVRTKTTEYRIRKATASIMKAQGSETWQIQGKAEMVERGAPARPSPGPVPQSPAAPSTTSAPKGPAAPATPTAPYVPDAADIQLVREQCKCDEATARRTLIETGGDLAEAIVKLS